jgi:hypothetical protein
MLRDFTSLAFRQHIHPYNCASAKYASKIFVSIDGLVNTHVEQSGLLSVVMKNFLALLKPHPNPPQRGGRPDSPSFGGGRGEVFRLKPHPNPPQRGGRPDSPSFGAQTCLEPVYQGFTLGYHDIALSGRAENVTALSPGPSLRQAQRVAAAKRVQWSWRDRAFCQGSARY